jgi:hypothetical protein
MDATTAPRIGSVDSMSVESWRARGLVYVAVADLPRADLQALRGYFLPAASAAAFSVASFSAFALIGGL